MWVHRIIVMCFHLLFCWIGIRALAKPVFLKEESGIINFLLGPVASGPGWPLNSGWCKHGPKFTSAVSSTVFRDLPGLYQVCLPLFLSWLVLALPSPVPQSPARGNHPFPWGLYTHFLELNLRDPNTEVPVAETAETHQGFFVVTM